MPFINNWNHNTSKSSWGLIEITTVLMLSVGSLLWKLVHELPWQWLQQHPSSSDLHLYWSHASVDVWTLCKRTKFLALLISVSHSHHYVVNTRSLDSKFFRWKPQQRQLSGPAVIATLHRSLLLEQFLSAQWQQTHLSLPCSPVSANIRPLSELQLHTIKVLDL